MNLYTYKRDTIISKNGHVGWLNNQIQDKLDCVLAIRNILKNYGHELKVESFSASIGDYEQVEPVIREVKKGYYITDLFDEINYAYFSKDMKCAKSCINAVLEVIT